MVGEGSWCSIENCNRLVITWNEDERLTGLTENCNLIDNILVLLAHCLDQMSQSSCPVSSICTDDFCLSDDASSNPLPSIYSELCDLFVLVARNGLSKASMNSFLRLLSIHSVYRHSLFRRLVSPLSRRCSPVATPARLLGHPAVQVHRLPWRRRSRSFDLHDPLQLHLVPIAGSYDRRLALGGWVRFDGSLSPYEEIMKLTDGAGASYCLFIERNTLHCLHEYQRKQSVMNVPMKLQRRVWYHLLLHVSKYIW